VLAEVVRSGFVESRHRGSVVALGPGGAVRLSAGDPYAAIFPRSANKPLQAAGMLRAGLPVDGELLAIAAASHSGQSRHVQLVRRLLDGVGLTVDALDNAPGWPLSGDAAAALVRAGAGPDRLHQNCSGKHAAMLATCVAAGWPTAGYRDPGHPVQQAIRAAVEDIADEPVTTIGVDGCGAPLLALTLAALARAFGRLAAAPAGSAERRVADAMRRHPDVVGGTGRDVSRLLAGVPGLVAKDGAEGVFAAGLPDGTGVAVKIDDGAGRVRTPVLVSALSALGAESPVLAELATLPVLGHGEPVGEVRPRGQWETIIGAR
jgi:L-asparaginase II